MSSRARARSVRPSTTATVRKTSLGAGNREWARFAICSDGSCSTNNRMVSKGFRVERTIRIQVPPERVLNAFFDPRDLGKWWRAVRSVTVPRPLGTYALEWHSTDYQDEVLGRLGGAFHGTVMDY